MRVFTLALLGLSLLACGDSGTSPATSADAHSAPDTSTDEVTQSAPDADEGGDTLTTDAPPPIDALTEPGDALDEEDTWIGDPVEVIGLWDTSEGGSWEITPSTWGPATIVDHDNEDNWAITQSPQTIDVDPGTFSKVVWTEPADGRWFACIVAQGLTTAEAAMTSGVTADASSPLEGGCGEGPWTELRSPMEVKGDWHTNWDENITITTYAWGSQEAIAFHHNEDNWAVTRMGADASWNANTYSKLVWTDPESDGHFWMCRVDYGLETASAAKGSPKAADTSDPATGGCSGFSWTLYMPIIELTGTWSSESGEHHIDSTIWDLTLVRDYDNTANWAIVETPATTPDTPGTFAKNVWIDPIDGVTYYCVVETGLSSVEEAIASAASADESDPETSGCKGQPWTQLTWIH